MKNRIPIILASASPRRSELLRQVGIDFIAMPADVDEAYRGGETPSEHALRLAAEKALSVAGQVDEGIVIGADTVVIIDGRVLGKPVDRENAVAMLRTLAGRRHQVMTGMAVLGRPSGKMLQRLEVTDVWFRELGDDEIKAYVQSGEPMDKAGAYGIQGKGALFVSRIEGCYNNVVGLPLFALGQMLKEMGSMLPFAPHSSHLT